MKFEVGQKVWYEVATRGDKDDFRVAAVVVATSARRVTVEFNHWSDGRLVRRAARPHRLEPRRSA